MDDIDHILKEYVYIYIKKGPINLEKKMFKTPNNP